MIDIDEIVKNVVSDLIALPKGTVFTFASVIKKYDVEDIKILMEITSKSIEGLEGKIQGIPSGVTGLLFVGRFERI